MRTYFLALFAVTIILTGCCAYFLPTTNESIKNTTISYTCPDGTIVSNLSKCPLPLVKCPDGSKAASLSKCPPMELTKPGWYTCNDKANYSPCKEFLAVYCDKFTPTELTVREAASSAISKHPGAFSVNQLLDIYDWVHSNVFYQNVPVNLTYQPYAPKETLSTKSGDCKNQAVLIASMVEAIGGTARVLLIPDCQHAFPEVYLGNQTDIDVLNAAIRAHYPASSGKTINWHISKNNTEDWYIFDSAGGNFPGQTIEDCFNASQTFVIYDCQNYGKLSAPEIRGTEYGPNVLINDSEIIRPNGYWYSYYIAPSDIPSKYRWCRYKISVESLSWPIDWYVTDEAGYYNYKNGMGFRYYCGEEQVPGGNCQLDWTSSNKFYIIEANNYIRSITARVQVVETCYK